MRLSLTELIRIVLCGRLLVILLYGLPNVTMVGASKAQRASISPAKRLQATILYSISRRCSTTNDEFPNCLYHVLGVVRTFQS